MDVVLWILILTVVLVLLNAVGMTLAWHAGVLIELMCCPSQQKGVPENECLCCDLFCPTTQQQGSLENEPLRGTLNPGAPNQSKINSIAINIDEEEGVTNGGRLIGVNACH